MSWSLFLTYCLQAVTAAVVLSLCIVLIGRAVIAVRADARTSLLLTNAMRRSRGGGDA